VPISLSVSTSITSAGASQATSDANLSDRDQESVSLDDDPGATEEHAHEVDDEELCIICMSEPRQCGYLVRI